MAWNDLRSTFADRTRTNFVQQEPYAMGVEEEIAHLDASTLTSLPAEVYQETLTSLGVIDHVDLKTEDDSPWEGVPVAAHFKDPFFDADMAHLDTFVNQEHIEQFFPEDYADIVAEISYDLSNEFEKATGVNVSLAAAHQERREIDMAKLDALPDGTALYRVGHVPGFMDASFEEFYNRARFEEDGYPSLEEAVPYMTQKRRYIDHLKSHGTDVMAIGGTDSIQVTMRPRMDNGVDAMFRDFFGGGDRVGMPVLSPLLYAPFMSSPVFDADGELVNHMGREWAYEKGLGDSVYVDTDGTRKWGYIPELADVQDTADVLDVFAEKRFQFSAAIPADALEVVEEDATLYEAYGDAHAQLEPGTEVNVRVGHDDYGPVTFTDFAADRAFEGIVSLPTTGDQEDDEVVVRADYTDPAMYGEDETFTDVAWNHFLAHSTGVWPNFSPRFDAGAFESRDFGNSPRLHEAIDTQAAAFRRWPEIQRYAEDVLGLTEVDAMDLRTGVAADGLDYTLPSGHTVEEAWYGPENRDGLLDILAEGIREASYGEETVPVAARDGYTATYRDTMEDYLAEGTYSDVFAEIRRENGFAAAMEATRVDAP